jgi:hypothetical protein
MGILAKIQEFFVDAIGFVAEVTIPPLFLALWLFSGIFIPFIYASNASKKQFLFNKFKRDGLHVGEGFINPQDDKFIHYALLLFLLINCVVSYSNLRLWLNGEIRTGIVLHTEYHEPITTYAGDNTQFTTPEFYLLTVSHADQEVYAGHKVPLKSLVTYLELKGSSEQPRLFVGSKFRTAFIDYPMAAAALSAVLLNLLVGMGLMGWVLILQISYFVQAKSEQVKPIPLYSKTFFSLCHFILIISFALLVIKSVYNEISSKYIGGTLVFLILIALRYWVLFESLFYFLLRRNFDELENKLIEIVGLALKVISLCSVFTILYKAAKNSGESLIEAAKGIFEAVFG